MTLADELSNVLPKDKTFKVLHVQSEAKECSPIIKHHVSHSQFHKPKLTVKFKHFLLLTRNDLIIFGIEVYNYFSISSTGAVNDPNTQHLFISKVDSTGLTDVKVNVNQVIKVFLNHLINIKYTSLKYRKRRNQQPITIRHVDKLLEPIQHYEIVKLSPYLKVKLSLFTKSSNQYFFPNSNKNAGKHVIDGDRLLKWWVRLINDVTNDAKDTLKSVDSNKPAFVNKLLIPGSTNPKAYLLPGWEIGSIYGERQKCVYSIPNFPDDPKTRFLEFLVVENRTDLDLQEFYHELGFRQEFRLGDVVGIIGSESQPFASGLSSSQDPGSGATVLTNKQYKKLVNMVKSEDYTISDDITVLVSSSIPVLINLYTTFSYVDIVGRYEAQAAKRTVDMKVNNLTGLVKRKKTKNS